MKKNEYVSPEMEIVEMTMQCVLLAGSGDDETLGEEKGNGPSDPNDF